MFNKKVILLILDGWGIAKPDKFNAILNSKTPNFDKLEREYPNIRLRADGEYVGLPEGQFGTSEINHGVIGSGKVIMQDLPRINNLIKDGQFYNNKQLIEACEHVTKNKSKLHLIGILSDGKVHCYNHHLYALLQTAKNQGVKDIVVHIFADGRDAPPKSVGKYVKELHEKADGIGINIRIGSIQGRFYLDRDREWAKTEKAIDLLVDGKGMHVESAEAAINYSYNQNVSDEFFEQFSIHGENKIEKNDSVIFFHYRSDRMHQIQKELLNRNVKNLNIVSFIRVFDSEKINIAFPRPKVNHTLARVLSENKKSQYHLTETEKYTHLTFFFNSGREEEYPKEEWEVVKSNRFVKPFYNFDPIMRAENITKKIIEKIKENKTDFMVINYPNTDMVGHTGNYEAAVIAAESVDYCLGKVYDQIKDKLDEYALIVTADHGNSDEMWDYESDQPHTQHTTNPVPFILVTDINCKLDRKESLEDIAPTILDLMGIKKPDSMEGESLIMVSK